jgi:hypothetical protein
MSTERELLEQALEICLNVGSLDLAREIKAALDQPGTGGMNAIDLSDDDSLRFVQRVLESDAPEADRQAARDMIVGIRTRVREIAKNKREPFCWAVITEQGLLQTAQRYKGSCDEIATQFETVAPLYTHPQPERKTLSELKIQELAEQTGVAIVCSGEGDFSDNLDAIIPFAHAVEAAVWEKMGCK